MAGYHATTETEYATHFASALSMPLGQATAMRLHARSSSKRFATDKFAAKWTTQLSHLIEMHGISR